MKPSLTVGACGRDRRTKGTASQAGQHSVSGQDFSRAKRNRTDEGFRGCGKTSNSERRPYPQRLKPDIITITYGRPEGRPLQTLTSTELFIGRLLPRGDRP